MKMFSGESIEVVITPSNAEMEAAAKSARILMARKIDQWILDKLTMEQLRNGRAQFDAEIKRRAGPQDSPIEAGKEPK